MSNLTIARWAAWAIVFAGLLVSPLFGDSQSSSTDVQYFKMVSDIKYNGNGQYNNQAETMFTVTKKELGNDKVHYSISTNDFTLNDADEQSESMSFVLDRKTRELSGSSQDTALFEMVNNKCVRSLRKVSKENIGKTWKQRFSLPFLDYLIPGDLRLTLTAMEVKTEKVGNLIAVRALSEPFIVRATKKDGGIGTVKSKINAVYVFDSDVDEVYLSISVFEAATKINGYDENLRHEVATYKTNSSGVAIDLSGIDDKFEKFIRKVGLSSKKFEVTKATELPHNAQFELLHASQVASICAATACEGSLNPVISVCLPAAKTVGLQSAGKVAMTGKMATIGATLSKAVPGMASMKIAAAPAFMGVGLGTAGAVAGGTAGTVAIASGGGSSSSSRSSSN